MSTTDGPAGDRVPIARADIAITGLTLAAICCALFYNGQDLVLYAIACTLMIAEVAATVWWRQSRATDSRIGPAGGALALLVLWSALGLVARASASSISESPAPDGPPTSSGARCSPAPRAARHSLMHWAALHWSSPGPC